MVKSAGDALFELYDGKLKKAKVMAFTTNVMYSLNWFLGFCSLTWASAVILGGLLTYLTQHDYYSVVVLLMLEAVRLSSATFFSRVVTWKLIHNSADPQRLVYHDARRQRLQGMLPILEQAIQLVVIAISILVPIRRLNDLHFLPPITGDPTPADDFDSLRTSLRLFYVLVLVNGVIASVAVMFSKIVVPFYVDSFSLRKYYEKIVWKGMDEGLLHSTDFELLSWTFQMQADEYRRNMRAFVVTKLYGDMMKFLYYYPKHKGFEAAKVAMGSDDTFEREAAVNIVGSWARLATEVEKSDDKGVSTSVLTEEFNSKSPLSSDVKKLDGEKHTYLGRLLAQRKLLARLADALDSDEIGRAASASFEKLGETDPECVLMVRSEGMSEKVADILMDHIHWTVAILGKPNNAITHIKAVKPLLSYLIESHELHRVMMEEERRKQWMTNRNHDHDMIGSMTNGNGHENISKYCTPAKVGVLKEDLWTVVSKYATGLKRTQAVAACTYYLLLSKEDEEYEHKKEELHKHLTEKVPLEKGEHLLEEEANCLKSLMQSNEWAWRPEWDNYRDVKRKQKMPWLARRRTSFIASSVTLVILAIASFFLLRYAHF